MKLVITLLLTIFSLEGISQKVPFYEQIAFDFFRDSLLSREGIKKKILVNPKLISYNYPFFWPACIERYTKSMTVLKTNQSEQKYITIYDDDKFIISNRTSSSRVRCSVTESFSMYDDAQIIDVVLFYNYHGVIYHIEVSKDGHVISWCKGGWTE